MLRCMACLPASLPVSRCDDIYLSVWSQTRGNGNCEYPQASTGLKCADRMSQLKALLGGVPLAMHWYGWNTELFDTKYPHYTMNPGVDKEVATLQAAGVHGK